MQKIKEQKSAELKKYRDTEEPPRVAKVAPVRVDTEPAPMVDADDSEPNYISDSKDKQEQPTFAPRRSPKLKDSLSQERPDMVSNVPYIIVALVANETAEVPRLVIQQHKYSRGHAAANLEMQLKE